MAHLVHNCAMKVRANCWLTAAFYYTKNLSEVRNFQEGFHDGGVLVRRAQEAVKAPNLATQLVEIEEQYSALVDAIQKMEDSCCTIRETYQKMTSLDFGADGCQIGRYIQERMSRNDISCIVKLGRGDISPHLYSLLSNLCVNRENNLYFSREASLEENFWRETKTLKTIT